MFRIGRFDFVLEPCGEQVPHIYRKNDKLFAFCGDNWLLDATGNRLSPEEATSCLEKRIAHFCDDGSKVTGIPIDFQTGLAAQEEDSISLTEYEKYVSPGDWMLHFHIPGGGGMKFELCRESFREASAFFASQYTDKPVKMIYTISWIGNPDWLTYMPQSNIADLIRASALFPVISTPTAGLYFVFGREDSDFASYPQTNSMQRAMMSCIRDRKRLRSAGMLIPTEMFR